MGVEAEFGDPTERPQRFVGSERELRRLSGEDSALSVVDATAGPASLPTGCGLKRSASFFGRLGINGQVFCPQALEPAFCASRPVLVTVPTAPRFPVRSAPVTTSGDRCLRFLRSVLLVLGVAAAMLQIGALVLN
jgi:hypothetical protein